MAQAGFTPISLYYSTTAAATPSAGNLVAGELALNTVDEKLYFKNSAGTVKLLASNATSAPVVSFSAGTTGFTPSTATTGAVTLAGTLATTNGGTGLTSFTSGGVVYASSSSALATGSALTWNGTNLGVTGAISVNTGAANLNALGLLSGSSGNRIGLSLGRTAQEAYIGIASTSNSIINGDVAGDLDILTTTGNIRFSTNAGASLQATLDTSGNLGLGVSPSAWYSGVKAVQFGTAGAVWSSNDRANLTANLYLDAATAFRYINNGYALRYAQELGAHTWYIAPSGTAGNAITFTQAMTLDASGLLGIGQTSPICFVDTYGNGAYTYARFWRSDEAGYGGRVGTGNTLYGAATTRSLGLDGFTSISLGIAGVEKMRLSSTGGFSVGTTADPGAGAIYATGNITAYYSDARLKTVSGKIENALDKVAQLSGVYYTNNDTAKSFGYDSDEVQVGVIAQEVEAVLPQIVKAAPFDLDQDGNSKSGENYKTVQYERLVPLLIEAINELQAKVKALEAK